MQPRIPTDWPTLASNDDGRPVMSIERLLKAVLLGFALGGVILCATVGLIVILGGGA